MSSPASISDSPLASRSTAAVVGRSTRIESASAAFISVGRMAAKALVEFRSEVDQHCVASDELRRLGCWCAEDALVEEDASNSFHRRKLRQFLVRGHVRVLALAFDGDAGIRAAFGYSHALHDDRVCPYHSCGQAAVLGLLSQRRVRACADAYFGH
eukprot:3444020-Pleurochrysis_carterae.AAC.2